jgi:hypothetical protein
MELAALMEFVAPMESAAPRMKSAELLRMKSAELLSGSPRPAAPMESAVPMEGLESALASELRLQEPDLVFSASDCFVLRSERNLSNHVTYFLTGS